MLGRLCNLYEKGKNRMLAQLTATLNNWLYTYILVILLIGAGLYFTVRTRFVQFRMLGESFRV